MEKITCTFYRPEKVNVNEFRKIVSKLADDFDILCTKNVDATDIYDYVYRLAEQARPLDRKPKMYFLGLDEPGNMPSDIRVAYFYKPTYLGAAIIIRSVLLHPELLDATFSNGEKVVPKCREAVRKVLPGVLLGCTGRGFSGQGYDGLKGLIATLDIFTKAGAAQFLEKYPEICKEFSDLYASSMQMMEERVSNGTMKDGWGEDYTEEAQRVLNDYHKGNSVVPGCTSKEKPSFVWYASYGSNINSARFQEYLNACGGDINTTENRSYTTKGTLYFAADSRRWGSGKGVAFLDENGEGTVLTRIYKVSREQFASIQSQEGRKYRRKLMLGIVDGMPVYTCTSLEKREDLNAPSFDYVQTILAGLKEAYPGVSEEVLLLYLIKHGGFSDDVRKVLSYIRNAPHAVTLREIAEHDRRSDIDNCIAAVQLLLSFGLVKQDSRSRRAGYKSEDSGAAFFTVPEKRDITDQVVFGVV